MPAAHDRWQLFRSGVSRCDFASLYASAASKVRGLQTFRFVSREPLSLMTGVKTQFHYGLQNMKTKLHSLFIGLALIAGVHQTTAQWWSNLFINQNLT
jgi:hypothetical protein